MISTCANRAANNEHPLYTNKEIVSTPFNQSNALVIKIGTQRKEAEKRRERKKNEYFSLK